MKLLYVKVIIAFIISIMSLSLSSCSDMSPLEKDNLKDKELLDNNQTMTREIHQVKMSIADYDDILKVEYAGNMALLMFGLALAAGGCCYAWIRQMEGTDKRMVANILLALTCILLMSLTPLEIFFSYTVQGFYGKGMNAGNFFLDLIAFIGFFATPVIQAVVTAFVLSFFIDKSLRTGMDRASQYSVISMAVGMIALVPFGVCYKWSPANTDVTLIISISVFALMLLAHIFLTVKYKGNPIFTLVYWIIYLPTIYCLCSMLNLLLTIVLVIAVGLIGVFMTGMVGSESFKGIFKSASSKPEKKSWIECGCPEIRNIEEYGIGEYIGRDGMGRMWRKTEISDWEPYD